MDLLLIFLPLANIFLSAGGDPAQSESSYYRAALFEHARLGDYYADLPKEVVKMNLPMYQRAAQVAASKGADIIVFPEYGIFPPYERNRLKDVLEQIPDPRQVSVNPCEQAEEFSARLILYTLSCMAKRNNIVVVANTGNIQPCNSLNDSKCPDDGVYHYNTLVAFNRNGMLISRYHKAHLFYELGMDLPQGPQNSSFETDFGTFAMFICFDIVFEDIVKAAKEVDNIILSPMWPNFLPLFNPVQLWEAWALGNKVTHLVPNINLPFIGAVGSGVFSGHFGAIKYTFNPDGLSKLLVTRVPRSKDERGPFPNPDSSITVITENGTEDYNEDEDGKDVPVECSTKILGETQIVTEFRCTHEDLANYTLVKLSKPSDTLEACSNGMCCSLSYSASSMNETYFLAVSNGTYAKFTRYFWCEENCVLVRCDDFEGKECVTFPLKSDTVFSKIELKANFTTEYVYPSVLKSSSRLAPKEEWSHVLHQDGDSINAQLQFESSSLDPFLVAGLNGRCYQRDPPFVR